jgi:hypothetical protein
MDEERNTSTNDDTAQEDDAREEDIVEDTDADTKDIVENADDNFDATENRFKGIEATLDKILGELSSLREAQGIMVENGAVINDTDTDIDFTDADNFVPPAELDLLI